MSTPSVSANLALASNNNLFGASKVPTVQGVLSQSPDTTQTVFESEVLEVNLTTAVDGNEPQAAEES